jgi:3-phytase
MLFVSILVLPVPSASVERSAQIGIGGSVGATVLHPRTSLATASIQDQDDMCIWVHPEDPGASTIITSDKDANRLFVYDLDGGLIQTVPVPGKPGNVDLRYDFPLGGDRVDIVAYNDRDQQKVMVFAVDPGSRELSRVDDDAIDTGANYGFCLYRSPVSGRFFAYTTAKNGSIEQYVLQESGGQVTGSLVRFWDIGRKTEGCVCDDEAAVAFFAEEDKGVWKVLAEPVAPMDGQLIAEVGGANGLHADVEGLALYHGAAGTGYLLVSSQSIDTFFVYQRQAPHDFVKTFTVRGAGSTDGIDVMNVALGSRYPAGMFALHNGARAPHAVEVCGWEEVRLPVDTGSWNPRGPTTTAVGASSWGRLKTAYR